MSLCPYMLHCATPILPPNICPTSWGDLDQPHVITLFFSPSRLTIPKSRTTWSSLPFSEICGCYPQTDGRTERRRNSACTNRLLTLCLRCGLMMLVTLCLRCGLMIMSTFACVLGYTVRQRADQVVVTEIVWWWLFSSWRINILMSFPLRNF